MWKKYIENNNYKEAFYLGKNNKEVWKEILAESKRLRDKYYDKKINLYYPGDKFPPISVTGTACQLNCKHCGRKYLKHMIPLTTPNKLKEYCKKLVEKGGNGCLISGGYTFGGFVPLKPFIEAIKEIKETTNLEINIHTGIVDQETAKLLAYAGVDSVSVDIAGDQKILDEIYGLKRKPEDYLKTLKNLKEQNIRITPHIGIGFYYGKILHEFKALRFVKEVDPDVLVFVVLRPTRGTALENVAPPSLEDTLLVMAIARIAFQNKSISLGCMRPSGRIRLKLEYESVINIVDRLATPSRYLITKLKKEGYEIKIDEKCCTL